MARKNVIPSHRMLDEISLAGSATSDPTNVVNLDRASISIDWTGSDAVGAVTVESRKLKEGKPEALADSDWKELDFGATIDITGASGSHEIIFDALDFTEFRVVFTQSSGSTGTLSATLTAKQIGG